VRVEDDEARRAYEADPSVFVPEGSRPPPYESVEERVKAILGQQKLDETTRGLLGKLRARARIETFL
jgi:hypothetical protein